MVLFTLGTPFIHRVLFTVTVCTFSSLALTDIFPKLCSAVSYDQLWVCKSVDYWSGVSKPWENVCTSVPNSSIQVQGGPYIRVQHSSWRVLGWVPESICVYAPGGGEGGAGHGVGIWLFLLALGWGIWLIFFSRGRGYLNPQTRTKTETNHWPIIRFPLHSMRCKVWTWKSV